MALYQTKYLLASLNDNDSYWGNDTTREALTILKLASLVGRGRTTIWWVQASWDGVEETLVETCWKWNLDRSTHNLIPWGESEEEPGGEGLNIYAGRKGEPVGETAGVTATTREPAGEKPGELAGAMDDACECGEFEPVLEEWSW
jgi:hypothetical protein